MSSPYRMYCLKDKDGVLVLSTLGFNKTDCWGEAFPIVADVEGKEWCTKYWKRERASMNNAFKLGWAIVPVEIMEIGG